MHRQLRPFAVTRFNPTQPLKSPLQAWVGLCDLDAPVEWREKSCTWKAAVLLAP